MFQKEFPPFCRPLSSNFNVKVPNCLCHAPLHFQWVYLHHLFQVAIALHKGRHTHTHPHTHRQTGRHQQFKKHHIIGHHGRSWQATHRSCSQRTGAVAAIRCCKQFELKLTHCLFMLSSNIFLVTSGRFYFFVCNILQHLMVAEQRVPVFMSSRFEI